MLCPKCRNNVTGKWCAFCGEKLEQQSPNTPDANSEFTNVQASDPQGTNDFYRDDIYNDNPTEEYISPEDAVNPYSSYYEEPKKSSNKSKTIAIVSVCIASVVIVGILLYIFVFSKSDSSSGASNNKPAVSDIKDQKDDETSKIKALTAKAENYMESGNYKKAEDAYSELKELTKDKEAQTIYDILFNYNRALKEFESGDYDIAEEYYDDIPKEYTNYPISSDVDDLLENIKNGIRATGFLDQIKDYISDNDIEGARETVDLINENHLSKSQKKELENLVEKLNELEAEEKENSRSHDYPDSGYGHLVSEDAQDIISTYCYNMVEAINSNDFGYVEPYILSTSKLYKDQQSLIESCNNQRISENFEWIELNKLTKISNTKWEAKVTEAETILYPDGNSEYKTFKWTYTIEYKDNYFYISGIK